jgi:hypothetical protein
MLAILAVKLDLERIRKMKQEALRVIQRIIDQYGNMSVIELEMALVEGLAKLGETDMRWIRAKGEDVI